MTFVQGEFLVFFTLVFTLYWSIGRRAQNMLLAVASAIFYGWVHPWFLILLYSSAILDFQLGLQMRRHPDKQRTFLIMSMCGNLGMLGYFKYCDFFIGNVISAFSSLGIETSMHTLGIFLPVGISFYTFQTMSYTLDIYRGKLEPRSNFLDYVVFVSFFPQLVAGPVERARDLLPQMEVERVFVWDRCRSGFGLAMWGAFKKVVVADTIAPYVDKAYMLAEPSGPLIWAATVGFAIQILADFSGYTDIARGVARMLGFELCQNFKNPYISSNPSEFWRRWHVSFSTWIRDYVYIGVGGSRGNFWYVTRNTFIAMLVSGLWHGAAWTFVLWGAYHAALLTGYRLVVPRIPASITSLPGARFAAIGVMFGFTTLGWMIFRETDIERLMFYLSLSPFHASADQWVATTTLMSIVALTATPLMIALWAEKSVIPRLRATRWYLPAETTALTFLALAIATFVRETADDFIYFQF
jgi:alginate O-acetyltransferase complex protein AlgI